MNLLDAHGLLFLQGDRTKLPPPDGVDTNLWRDYWSAFATAAVALSGQLDDAETIYDLHDAIEHFQSLLGAEVVTLQQWGSEAERVRQSVDDFGARIEAGWRDERRRQSELN